jgi:hypothetical protein
VTVNLTSPEDTSSEDDWSTDLKIVAEKEVPEEEYIDLEDILALPTPTEREKGETY